MKLVSQMLRPLELIPDRLRQIPPPPPADVASGWGGFRWKGYVLKNAKIRIDFFCYYLLRKKLIKIINKKNKKAKLHFRKNFHFQ